MVRTATRQQEAGESTSPLACLAPLGTCRLPAAAEELLQSGSAASLAALLLHSAAPQRQRQALDKLVAMADTCSGDEFAALAGTTPGLPAGAARECAVFKAWQLASAAQQPGKNGAASALASAATAFLLRCCERAQRQQQLGPGVPPRGGAWGAIGRQGLLSLLRQARPGAAAAAGQQQQQEPAFSSSMRKGFLAGPSQAAGKAANGAACKSSGGGGSSGAAASSPPSISTHSYKRGGVVIEELPSQATAAAAAAAAPPLAAPAAVPSPRAQPRAPEPEPSGAVEQEGEEDAEEEAVAELRDVFDSSSSATAEQRRARAEWLAVPGEQRLRWSQTSGDVSVYVAVPAGTRASEVQVRGGRALAKRHRSALAGLQLPALRLAGRCSFRSCGLPATGAGCPLLPAGHRHSRAPGGWPQVVRAHRGGAPAPPRAGGRGALVPGGPGGGWRRLLLLCLSGASNHAGSSTSLLPHTPSTPLCGPCPPHPCSPPSTAQVHVLLPKADGAVWKALLQGGAERSYMELLREAVDAGEAAAGAGVRAAGCRLAAAAPLLRASRHMPCTRPHRLAACSHVRPRTMLSQGAYAPLSCRRAGGAL